MIGLIKKMFSRDRRDRLQEFKSNFLCAHYTQILQQNLTPKEAQTKILMEVARGHDYLDIVQDNSNPAFQSKTTSFLRNHLDEQSYTEIVEKTEIENPDNKSVSIRIMDFYREEEIIFQDMSAGEMVLKIQKADPEECSRFQIHCACGS